MLKFFNRIYNDYFMKSRLNEYEKMVLDFINNDYEFITISEYKKLKEKNKHLMIRHDIDSDLSIAKKMFEIEKKLNVKSTYYFRQQTCDKKFIAEILKYGSEVGYHYEELATFCKKNNIQNKNDIMNSIDEIKKQFEANIKQFETKYNVKLTSIASHGDFINRKFDISNAVLFDDKLRKKFNKIIEAYDSVVEGNIDLRISDCMYPKFWKPVNPNVAIEQQKNNVLLLIHTRWWDSAPVERFKSELLRIFRK